MNKGEPPTIASLSTQLEGHETLDNTRFEYVKETLDAIWRRTGRMEVAAWASAMAILGWALAHIFMPLLDGKAQAAPSHYEMRGER